MSELEEIEREDNFRLKRFKELKNKRKVVKNQVSNVHRSDCTCPTCMQNKLSVESKSNVSYNSVRSVGDENESTEKGKLRVTVASHELDKDIRPLLVTLDRIKKIDADQFSCSICTTSSLNTQPEKGDLGSIPVLKKENMYHSKSRGDLERLSTQIDEIIMLIDGYKAQGLLSKDVDDFVCACLEAKSKISNKNSKDSNISITSGEHKKLDVENKEIGHLKSTLKEIIKVTKTPTDDMTISEEKQTATLKTVQSISYANETFYNDNDLNKEHIKTINVITRESKPENVDRVKTDNQVVWKRAFYDTTKAPSDKSMVKNILIKFEKRVVSSDLTVNVSRTASRESTKSCQCKSPSRAPTPIVSGVSKGYLESVCDFLHKYPSSHPTKNDEDCPCAENIKPLEKSPQSTPNNFQSIPSYECQCSQHSRHSYIRVPSGEHKIPDIKYNENGHYETKFKETDNVTGISNEDTIICEEKQTDSLKSVRSILYAEVRRVEKVHNDDNSDKNHIKTINFNIGELKPKNIVDSLKPCNSVVWKRVSYNTIKPPSDKSTVGKILVKFEKTITNISRTTSRESIKSCQCNSPSCASTPNISGVSKGYSETVCNLVLKWPSNHSTKSCEDCPCTEAIQKPLEKSPTPIPNNCQSIPSHECRSSQSSHRTNISVTSGAHRNPDLKNNAIDHFERKFKEIVKVTRIPKEDGTICEKTETTTVKTVKIISCTKDACLENPFNENDINNLHMKKNNVNIRKSRSENIISSAKTRTPIVWKRVSSDTTKSPCDKSMNDKILIKFEKPRVTDTPVNISRTASRQTTKSCECKSPSCTPTPTVSGVSRGYSEAVCYLLHKWPSSNLPKSSEDCPCTEDTKLLGKKPESTPNNFQSIPSYECLFLQHSQPSYISVKSSEHWIPDIKYNKTDNFVPKFEEIVNVTQIPDEDATVCEEKQRITLKSVKSITCDQIGRVITFYDDDDLNKEQVDIINVNTRESKPKNIADNVKAYKPIVWKRVSSDTIKPPSGMTMNDKILIKFTSHGELCDCPVNIPRKATTESTKSCQCKSPSRSPTPIVSEVSKGYSEAVCDILNKWPSGQPTKNNEDCPCAENIKPLEKSPQSTPKKFTSIPSYECAQYFQHTYISVPSGERRIPDIEYNENGQFKTNFKETVNAIRIPNEDASEKKQTGSLKTVKSISCAEGGRVITFYNYDDLNTDNMKTANVNIRELKPKNVVDCVKTCNPVVWKRISCDTTKPQSSESMNDKILIKFTNGGLPCVCPVNISRTASRQSNKSCECELPSRDPFPTSGHFKFFYNDDDLNKDYTKRNNVNLRESKPKNIVDNAKTCNPVVWKRVSCDTTKTPGNKSVVDKILMKFENRGESCDCLANISQTASRQSNESCECQPPSRAPTPIVSGSSRGYSEAISVLVHKYPSTYSTTSSEDCSCTRNIQKPLEKSPTLTPNDSQSISSCECQSSQSSQNSNINITKTNEAYSCVGTMHKSLKKSPSPTPHNTNSRPYREDSSQNVCTIKIVTKSDDSNQKQVKNMITISASTMSIFTKLLSLNFHDTRSKSNRSESNRSELNVTRDPSQEKLVTDNKKHKMTETTSSRKVSEALICRNQRSPYSHSPLKSFKQKTCHCTSPVASTESNKSKYICCESSNCSKMDGQKCGCSKKDVSSQTRRSDKYDVRPLSMLMKSEQKIKTCNCRSDTEMIKGNKAHSIKSVKKCYSIH